MTSARPYLLRAMYEWLLDNHLTPFLVIDASHPDVLIPTRYVKDGQIVLNIAFDAVKDLQLGNEVVEFDARFSGVPFRIYAPILAVRAIYAEENGQGMVFSNEEEDGGGEPPPKNLVKKPKSKRSHLQIVK